MKFREDWHDSRDYHRLNEKWRRAFSSNTYSKRCQCGDQNDGCQLFSNTDSHVDQLPQDANPNPPMFHALCMCTLS